jgi:hypothetical protein
MLAVINQFKRILNDDGRDDKDFTIQETRLKVALEELRLATNNLIRASQTLSDVLMLNKFKKLH